MVERGHSTIIFDSYKRELQRDGYGTPKSIHARKEERKGKESKEKRRKEKKKVNKKKKNKGKKERN